MSTAERPPSQPPKPTPVTIPSPRDVAKRPSDTGLLNRAATVMAGKPDIHPSGCLCFTLDLGNASESEVSSLLVTLSGDGWNLEVQPSNQRRGLIIEDNAEKFGAWKAAQAEEVERAYGLRRETAALVAVGNKIRGDLQAFTQATRDLLKHATATR